MFGELWWIAPAAAGAAGGAAAMVVGARRRQRLSGRRLGYDAARLDLQAAQRAMADRRRAVKAARAEHARVAAERTASRASSTDTARSRRALKQAESDVRAAAADVRARRLAVTAAREEIPAAAQKDRYPLTRLMRAHDAVLSQWMVYETDPAMQIAYPAMSDGKNTDTAAFFAAMREARDRRPAGDAAEAVIDVSAFGAYRDAVLGLERAFAVAEHSAHELAAGRDPHATPLWQDTAQQVFSASVQALDKAAGAAASALASWNARRGDKNDDQDRR